MSQAAVTEIVMLSMASIFAILLALAVYYAVQHIAVFVNSTVDDAAAYLESIGPRIQAVGVKMDAAFASARTSIIAKGEAMKQDITAQVDEWGVKIQQFSVNVKTTWECAPSYFLTEVDQALNQVGNTLDSASVNIATKLAQPALYDNIVLAVFQSINDMLGC